MSSLLDLVQYGGYAASHMSTLLDQRLHEFRKNGNGPLEGPFEEVLVVVIRTTNRTIL
jgi:hypothetical protein